MSLLGLIAAAQVLLTFTVQGEGPVRFGFPLRAVDLERGLHLQPATAELQWRVLQERPDPVTGRLWVELAVLGARGRTRLMAGAGRGRTAAVVERSHVEREEDGRRIGTTVWRWRTGDEDRVERIAFEVEHVEQSGERFAPGEFLTEASPAAAGRWLRVSVPRRYWEAAGILPPDQGLARELRRHLVQVAARLPELPGSRGRGDYGRSGGVVTNLEFDTTLALLHLGLASGDREVRARAGRAARHLVDRDLDPRTGLPFRHGPDHRAALPEPGHVWLQGLLLTGCVTADDGLIAGARTIARGLARNPLREVGRVERARDLAWPLLEIEAWLRFADDRVCAAAADRIAQALLVRFDPAAGVIRFGEGERRSGLYEERAWITGGIVLPALRAHGQRRPRRELQEVISVLEDRLAMLCRSGRAGLPVRYLLRGSEVVSELRLVEVPELPLVLEGVAPGQLPRLLGRSTVRRALGLLPLPDDPDLATSFTKVARCRWVLR